MLQWKKHNDRRREQRDTFISPLLLLSQSSGKVGVERRPASVIKLQQGIYRPPDLSKRTVLCCRAV